MFCCGLCVHYIKSIQHVFFPPNGDCEIDGQPGAYTAEMLVAAAIPECHLTEQISKQWDVKTQHKNNKPISNMKC